MLLSSPYSFQNYLIVSTGRFDFHTVIVIILKSSYIKLKAKGTYYREYKKFISVSFRSGLLLRLDRANKDYGSFEDAFIKILNRHEPIKQKLIRANKPTFSAKPLKKTILKRSDDVKYRN